MAPNSDKLKRNIRLYPWYQLLQHLLFWQANWFLFFQDMLSAADAILLYVIFDLTVTLLEVPSGYMSDRLGRRITLILSAAAFTIGLVLIGFGGGFLVFAAGQVLMGAGRSFASGTDSAFLYQSLVALKRGDEMETFSFRAWRFGFSGLCVSAVIGGGMALLAPGLPFLGSALALACAVWLAILFVEPPADGDHTDSEWARMKDLMGRFRQPVLLWLFCLSVLMYGFSHIPFVFGQPFIASVLDGFGAAQDAPFVSGAITALMMGLSLLVSLVVPALRARTGLFGILLLAFAIQIGLAAALAMLGSLFAIALLLLRMVPDSMSTPIVEAHLQPLLGDQNRATFLSIKSLVGRMLFAGSLAIAATSTSGIAGMPLEDIQAILWVYAVAGFAFLAMFAATARRVQS